MMHIFLFKNTPHHDETWLFGVDRHEISNTGDIYQHIFGVGNYLQFGLVKKLHPILIYSENIQPNKDIH